MKNDTRSADADNARVREILSGAYRGPLDPDLDLFATLADLRGSETEVSLDEALERLARDARPD